MRILVVDDDPTIRDLVSLQLEMEGHDVTAASDGQAAMDLLETATSDVVVLDVMMPGLNGWDVLERLRAADRPHRPAVVLLTAKDLPHDRQRARELGALALLAKPHDGQQLVDLLKAVAGTLPASS